jgi:hypothetical protein
MYRQRSRSILGHLPNQEMPKLLANGVALFAFFIDENCDNRERFCYCLTGHSTLFLPQER